jgi:hypothetical protein
MGKELFEEAGFGVMYRAGATDNRTEPDRPAVAAAMAGRRRAGRSLY